MGGAGFCKGGPGGLRRETFEHVDGRRYRLGRVVGRGDADRLRRVALPRVGLGDVVYVDRRREQALTVLLAIAFLDKHASPMGVFALVCCIAASSQYKQSPLRADVAKAQGAGDVEVATA